VAGFGQLPGNRAVSRCATAPQGGVERIKNTPLPKQCDFSVMLFVQAYCLLLPVGMIARLGW
jgi:predicted membrane chloride channel (bestrophin family)